MTVPLVLSGGKHRELVSRLLAEGPLADCTEMAIQEADRGWPGGHIEAAVRGRLVVSGVPIGVRVGLPAGFPRHLPEIAVDEGEAARDWPHVERSNGKICFQANDGLLLDTRDPWGLLVESLALAADTLALGKDEGARSAEFVEEIVAYWGRDAAIKIFAVVEASDEAKSLTALYRENVLRAVADSPEAYACVLAGRNASACSHQNAAYFPVDPLAVLPNFHPRDLEDHGKLVRLVAPCLDGDRTLRKRLLGYRKREELVLLGVKRARGPRALIGLLFRSDNRGHPLLLPAPPSTPKPVSLRRMDLGYLAPRGGADAMLKDRRTLLLGCGSVGGYLAVAVAKAGIGRLSLVDKEVFAPENTFRHVCGMAHLGENKTVGLKMEIERMVPHVKVGAHPTTVDAFLGGREGDLTAYDLVVVALGDPTAELHINGVARARPGGPPVIFAWLEPLGLGGHALLTRAGERGCLECLYRRPVVGGPLVNRAAFARPGPAYTRELLGCGSRHLPFGDLDASRTAEVAARLALEALRGDEPGCALVSWKGDGRAFVAAGHQTTARYESHQHDLDGQRGNFARSDCLGCGAGKP